MLKSAYRETSIKGKGSNCRIKHLLRAVMDHLICCSHCPRLFSSKKVYVDTAITITTLASYLVT